MAISGMRWGDEEDDVLPQRTESEPDSQGVRQIVEWKLNDAGDKVKVTKKIKKVTEVERVSKRALERKKWAKFGDALDDGDGSNVTYMSYEEVKLEDPNADQVLPGEKKEEENIFAGVKNSSIVVCRHCGMVGDHWTLKCPYKDTPKEELEQDMAKRAEAGESAAPRRLRLLRASPRLVAPLWTAPSAPASTCRLACAAAPAVPVVTSAAATTRATTAPRCVSPTCRPTRARTTSRSCSAPSAPCRACTWPRTARRSSRAASHSSASCTARTPRRP